MVKGSLPAGICRQGAFAKKAEARMDCLPDKKTIEAHEAGGPFRVDAGAN
jgi:hypothetical protein